MGLKRRLRVEPEFSLAAMIDVIFLLLMFFMLTSKFVTVNALNLQLPSSSAASDQASHDLRVSINSAGQFFFNERPIDPARLEPALKGSIAGMKEDAKSTTITVEAEQGVPIENVVTVLDIANRLKIKTILATEPKVEK